MNKNQDRRLTGIRSLKTERCNLRRPECGESFELKAALNLLAAVSVSWFSKSAMNLKLRSLRSRKKVKLSAALLENDWRAAIGNLSRYVNQG